MTDRYQRQTILSEIGPAGQNRLGKTSVLCIGAGGLGSPALLYMAAAGIGRLGVADFDQVDESNLQRQVLYETAQTGIPKTEAAKKKLLALNPAIHIETYPDGLNMDNVEELFQDYDIILDGTDNFEAKYLINDAGVKYGKPIIYGAIQKFTGQVSVFDGEHGPCYRCLYPEKPKEQVLNCAEAGIIGAIAGIAGVTQAMQAIMLASPHESFEPLIGKLWTINAKTMETKLLEIPKDPACPVCSKNPEDITLYHSNTVCSAIPEVTPQQASEQADALLIDVREIDEWNAGHIETADHIALSSLMDDHIPNLAKDRNIILYCKSGKRSLHAARILKAKGYENVINLTGGYEAWIKAD